MQHFFYIFTRYLTERAQSVDLYVSTIFAVNIFSTQLASFSDWERIKSPSEDKIVPYADLPKPTDSKNLSKLAVLKVNGGLGTSMGSFFKITPPDFFLLTLMLLFFRYDRCQKCSRSQRRHDFP